MPLSQIRNVVGSTATAAVLNYSYVGAPLSNPVASENPNIPISAPTEISYDYYQLLNQNQTLALEQIDIMHKFASNILENIRDLEPEFSKTVDENFWDLI